MLDRARRIAISHARDAARFLENMSFELGGGRSRGSWTRGWSTGVQALQDGNIVSYGSY